MTWSERYPDEAEPLWACIYCGAVWTSPNGTGSDIACCGEQGHVEEME